jgi:type IV pilus assembly protein PilC
MAGRTPKLDDQARSIFLGGIASALRAGHEPKVALELLAQDDLDPRLASAAQTLAARIAGKSLSESMASMPRTFEPATVATVREGESAGRVADFLDLIAADRARSADFGPRLALALFFPLIALGVAVLVLLFLAVFVMPAFRSVFAAFGADLPVLTLFYVGIADFIESYWLFLVAAFIAIVIAFSWRSRFGYGKYIDALLLRMPFVAGQLRRAYNARLAGLLADAARLGIDARAALAYLRDSAGNRVLAERTDALCREAAAASDMASWLATSKSVPRRLSIVAGTGAAADRLAAALAAAADQYAEAARVGGGRVERNTFILAYVIVGLIVGSFVIAMYLPIFKAGGI